MGRIGAGEPEEMMSDASSFFIGGIYCKIQPTSIHFN